MSYTVELKRSAVKELSSLSSENQQRVAAALAKLAENPLPPGVKKLQARDGYRIRVGEYRVIYTIEGSGTVSVSAIRHRREAYR